MTTTKTLKNSRNHSDIERYISEQMKICEGFKIKITEEDREEIRNAQTIYQLDKIFHNLKYRVL